MMLGVGNLPHAAHAVWALLLPGGRVELSLLDQRVMSLPIADVVSPHCERVIQGEGMPITR